MFLYSPKSSTICFSFSTHTIQGSMSYKKSKAIVNNQNSSASLSDDSLFSSTATSTSSSPSGTCSETLISIKSSPLIPLAWCLLALEFLHILKPFTFTFFCHIHNFFHDFFDWLCCKSCDSTYIIFDTVFSSRNLLSWAWWLSQLFL